MAGRDALKKPAAPKPKFDSKDDDWDTDLTYENTVTEKSQRYGSSSVPGSGRVDHVDMSSIHDKVKTADAAVKDSYQGTNPNRGYGGKFGKDEVMDKNAADFSYKADTAKHSSQTDGKKGFGGAHGIDERAKDASAVGFDYKANVEKHSSQTDSSKGFGGKFGTDQSAQDKSAVGFSHKETTAKYSSQTDYAAGFGGKHGVQKEEPSRVAPVAAAKPTPEPKVEEKAPAAGNKTSGKLGGLLAKFENLKKDGEAETAKRVAEERSKRAAAEKQQQAAVEKKDDPPKQPKAPVVQKETPAARPKTPPPVEDVPPTEEKTTESKTVEQAPAVEKEETDKIVGGINVSSILHERKASLPAATEEEDDTEWADDQKESDTTRDVQKDPPAAETTDEVPNEGLKCIARYGYEKVDDDELGFEEKQIITNVEKTHDDWWFGRIGSRSGTFPSSYVEELP